MDKYPIDIVIPWVDPTDPEWQKQRRFYAGKTEIGSVVDNTEIRFRDWGTLKYLFRSIEKFAPWVRTVHFITCGHLPSWMNTKAPKLHIVKHTDYMDMRYLPTFSSHAIELCMHQIEGLAEHFIYFNDDILLLRPVKPTIFFKQGLPRDYAILNPAISSHRFSVLDTAITDIEIINDHFLKNRVIANHPFKWFNPRYGMNNLKTLMLMPWPRFAHMYGRHLCNAFLKSTFTEVWEQERDILDSTCLHKFRTRCDVNQWLMREWQLAKGSFKPISPNHGRYYALKSDNSALIHALKERKYEIICINDNGEENITSFSSAKQELMSTLDEVFIEQSNFENRGER